MPGALVVGGAGFIGTHLLEDLAGRHFRPLVSADISEPRYRVLGVNYQQADIRQPLDISAEGIDVIYNLAGLVAIPGHPDADYYATNVAGALSVCRFASDHAIQRIVFTSSMSVYPTGEEAKTENSVPRPANAYGRSKLLAESVHEQWLAGQTGRQLVICRPAVIFGPNERGNFLRLWKLLSRRLFFYPGRRDTIKACGYVTDLVASFHFAQSRTEDYTLYNFAYEQRLTIEDICSMISREQSRPAPGHILPLTACMAGARPFEALDRIGIRTGINRARINKLVESTNIYPSWLQEHGFEFSTEPSDGIALWADSLRQGS